MAIIRYLHLGLTAACNLNCKHCFIKEKESKELSFEKAIAFIDVLEKQGLTHMVRYRGAEGCTTVEMECAALAACARKRGASFGQILYTADSLANIYAHDERDWGKGSLRKALELCIAVLQTI